MMTVAEKLQTIAENEQKVYDAGYAKGQDEEKLAAYDHFWDTYQQKGNRLNYMYAFAGVGWTEEWLQPKYDMRPTNCTYMFARLFSGNAAPVSLAALLERAGVTLDTSNSENHIAMFNEALYVSEIPHIDLTKSKYATNLFNYCISLKKVAITVAPNTVPNTAGWFGRCDALEDLTVNGTLDKSLSLADSAKLSAASVDSILAALADLTGQTAQTLTLHAMVKGALTDDQKAAIAAKNWVLA